MCQSKILSWHWLSWHWFSYRLHRMSIALEALIIMMLKRECILMCPNIIHHNNISAPKLSFGNIRNIRREHTQLAAGVLLCTGTYRVHVLWARPQITWRMVPNLQTTDERRNTITLPNSRRKRDRGSEREVWETTSTLLSYYTKGVLACSPPSLPNGLMVYIQGVMEVFCSGILQNRWREAEIDLCSPLNGGVYTYAVDMPKIWSWGNCLQDITRKMGDIYRRIEHGDLENEKTALYILGSF